MGGAREKFQCDKIFTGDKIRVKNFAHSMHGRKRRKICLGETFRLYTVARVHNRKREESIALAYHPCAKFSGGQVGANMSESACG